MQYHMWNKNMDAVLLRRYFLDLPVPMDQRNFQTLDPPGDRAVKSTVSFGGSGINPKLWLQ